jgi:hypothetical protein
MPRALVPVLLPLAVNVSAADYDICFHVVPSDVGASSTRATASARRSR